MIKTYCDRCGKDLTPKPKSPLVAFVESVAKDLKGFSFSFKVDPAPKYVVKCADDQPCELCSECKKDFERFMRNEKDGNDCSLVILDEKTMKPSKRR